MKISRKEIEKLAHLARLELTEQELTRMESDMARILKLVEKVNELDLDGIEPLVYMGEDETVLRPDVAKREITQEEALKNAPDADTDYFKVPKVLKED